MPKSSQEYSMFRAITIILLCTIGISAICQERVEGTIIDRESGKPVPFASVGILGSSRGTSTNLQGQFSIGISGPVTLMISCIGYESLSIGSNQLESVIKLRPKVTQLNTILVTNKAIRPEKIVKKALAKIKQNFDSEPFAQTFFYRHYCNDGGTYGRLVEASVDVWKNSGYRSTQSRVGQKESIRITQLRRSLDRTKVASGHEAISVADILETDIVGYQAAVSSAHQSMFTNISDLKIDFSKYSFEYYGITTFDGKEVYEIKYAHDKDSALTTSGNYTHYPYVQGTLFIVPDDYAIVKTEHLKTQGQDSVSATVFYREFENHYYPYHFLIEGQDQNEAIGQHEFHIELMSVEIDRSQDAKFEGDLPDRNELLKIPYDSTFWATSTILKTTPLEDQIIRDLGGGKSLNEQFQTYHQYQLSIHNGGVDPEEKFKWLRSYSKNKWPLYLVFWSENFKPYLIELEKAKQLNRIYGGQIKFVFISVDEDQERWSRTVQNFNYFSDGIINYRVGARSKLAREFKVKQPPHFILINKNGEPDGFEAPRPTDPKLAEDFERVSKKVADVDQ